MESNCEIEGLIITEEIFGDVYECEVDAELIGECDIDGEIYDNEIFGDVGIFIDVKGPKGDTGSIQESFESVSKNAKSWNYSLNYTAGNLTSIVYTDGTNTITKTFNYTTGNLTSIVLSGDTPSGIDLTKTFTYSGSNITDISYS